MNRFLILSAISISFLSCQKNEQHATELTRVNSSNSNALGMYSFMRYSGVDYSQPILIDTANLMIGSYLSSIGYPDNNTDLRSLTFDADTLRAYLSNERIVTLKFMLAHKMSYINKGNYGENAGTNAAAMTLIIVGLDENDNYIYNKMDMVYDHLTGCPAVCNNSGTILSQ